MKSNFLHIPVIGTLAHDVLDGQVTPLSLRRLQWMVGGLLLFNLCDLLFTIYYLSIGSATEANPIMAFYYSIHPLCFAVAKNVLIAGSIYLLAHLVHHSAVRSFLVVLTLFYTLVFSYHVASFKTYGLGFIHQTVDMMSYKVARR